MIFFNKTSLALILASFFISENAFAVKRIKIEGEETPTIVGKLRHKIEQARAKKQKKKDKLDKKYSKRKAKREQKLEKLVAKRKRSILAKNVPGTLPKTFNFKINELPPHTKKFATTLFNAKRGSVKLTPAQLDTAFAKIEKLEHQLPGMTAKICEFAKKGGYTKRKGKVKIKSSHIANDPDMDMMMELLSLRYPKLEKKHIKGVTSAEEMTEELEDILKHELDFQGIVDRLKPWFEERLGLKWENSHFRLADR